MISNDKPNSEFPSDMVLQKFSVPYEYPVYFTRRVFDGGNGLLADVMDRLGEKRRHRAAVYIDAGVVAAHPQLLDEIKEYFHARPESLELCSVPALVPGGEAAKAGWAAVRDTMWTIGNLHLDRQSFIIAIGGGGVLDMVGFATAIVHRGLRLIRVPTTTLSQNDAGVGVKNGMNEHGMKNFVGTFAPPFAVLNDASFLATLAQRDWIGGAAEAFKVAIIKDAGFFDFLCAQAKALRARQQGPMEELVRRCAVMHLEHIRGSGDPFEFGSARPLDFGHWSAHKLEVMSNYALGHGHAVAIGLAIDSYYAMREGLIAGGDFERLIAGLAACRLPIYHPLLERRDADGTLEIIRGLESFREHLGGTLTITLPKGTGHKIEVHQISPQLVEEAIAHLKCL
jgi:3-dehydroquinate synthase